MTTSWSRTLERARIPAGPLRRDYAAQRRAVARFARAEYVAARLLLPPELVPDVLAAVAFMHETDDRIDRGNHQQRSAALQDWRSEVHQALRSGEAHRPVLRTLLHTAARHPQLTGYVQTFLTGAEAEVGWQGFANESQLHEYIEAYSLPAFMLTACLLGQGAPSPAYRAGCRDLIEAMQRLDWMEDLAEDLPLGRLGIARTEMTAHGVTPADLLPQADNSVAVGRLLAGQAERSRSLLTRAHGLDAEVLPAARPFVRALIVVQFLRLRAVESKGPALREGPPRTPAVAALRVLGREYLRSRSARQQLLSRS